jgi:proteic killer suppression protein
VIASFGDTATRDVADGIDSKDARSISKSIWGVARRKLDYLHAAHDVMDLASPPGNRLEKLTGNLKGFWSIRVNEQYRIIFKWERGTADEVRIVDYH